MICKLCGRELDRKVEMKIHRFIDHRPKKKRLEFYFWNVKSGVPKQSTGQQGDG